MSWLHNEKARDARRRSAISAYVGANGHGKSLLAVYDSLPDLDEGREVYSTVRLLDFRNRRPCDGIHHRHDGDVPCDLWAGGPDGHAAHMAAHPYYVPLTNYAQLVASSDCAILLDEVTGGFSSGQSVPGAVVNLLVQLRRQDRCLRYTTPAWARTNIVIRETTQAVNLLTGYMSREVEGRQWRSRRLFRVLTYQAADMDEFSSADRKKPLKGKRVRADRFAMHWGGDIHGETGGFAAYDTYAPVTSLASLDETGRCLVCNKPQRTEYCAGHHR